MNPLMYQSDKMNVVMKTVSRIAPRSENVLIVGELGTGKKTIAQNLHNLSGRKDKPLVTVDCGEINIDILEIELFGQQDSSGKCKRVGLIEMANGGSLILDNLLKLPETIQDRLLQYLKSKSFYRVGGNKEVFCDVRIISLTNHDIESKIAEGFFDESLFYQLNTLTVNIPSLAQRKEDVELIIKSQLKSLSEEAMSLLKTHQWAGNLKELKNVCDQLSLIEGEVTAEEVEALISPKGLIEVPYKEGVALYDIEKAYILKALAFYGGNKTKAASGLGITIKTLYNKLHEYGVFDKV